MPGGPAFGWLPGDAPWPLRGSRRVRGGDGSGAGAPLPKLLGKAAAKPAGGGPAELDGTDPDPAPRPTLGPPPSCASSTDKSGVEAKDGPDDVASANNTPLSSGDDAGSDCDTVSADGIGASEDRAGAGAKVGLLLELAVTCTLDAPAGRARPSPTARDGS